MIAVSWRREVSALVERIDIERETIGHALTDNRLYVPINQRSYAWEAEHVKELYQDFAKAIQDGESEYFLGSIVVIRAADGRIEVNDGQQRLATSAILIAAIRDYFYLNGSKETAENIQRHSLLSPDRRTGEKLPSLQLNADDHDYFLKRILYEPDSQERKAVRSTKESHEKIDEAAKIAARHVRDIVSPYREQHKFDQLHTWLDFIDKGARVIWVQVADQKTAYIVFETMNDRGLRLSAADLLKNHLCMQTGDRREEAVHHWQSMVGALETVPNEDDILVTYMKPARKSVGGSRAPKRSASSGVYGDQPQPHLPRRTAQDSGTG